MDDEIYTAPDVIGGEAEMTVERPLARVPLVLHRRNFRWITERISGVVENPAPRWWWVTFTITASVAIFGLFCLGSQISPCLVARASFGGFSMVLTLLIPARALFKLHDIITPQHIDKMAKIILLTGSFVTYAYAMEFFVAWYSGNAYERFAFWNRVFGPYWWYWWVGMLFCNILSPQLFWFRWCRRNILVVYFVCMCVNAGMWFERFIIIVGGLHRDFIPSSWGIFIPTWVDIWTFIGTLGIFTSLFLLFIRFLPMIAMSEVKIVLPDADPHYIPPTGRHPVQTGGMERT